MLGRLLKEMNAKRRADAPRLAIDPARANGWSIEIEQSGADFYAHKTGFTWKTLADSLWRAGFAEVWRAPAVVAYELRALPFRGAAAPEQRRRPGMPGA